MAFKARHRYVAYSGINFKNNFYTGTVWECQGKTQEYRVEMVKNGFTCDCPGFVFHGKCRHITRVGEALLGHSSFRSN